MSYKSWFENHAQKHQNIIDKLQDLSDDEIIEYFRYENMVLQEPDFCPLYKDNKKCHDMKDLNCYLCGCSNFRLTNIKSYCSINSKYGGTIEGKDGFIHQNCSACTIPHKESFIKKNFNRSWKTMMRDVI
ncbi:MAG: hypothetical protein KAQ94_05520 [Arcobacteraceae bacterium]|nr:hypothetical protein [Arcobacteraceae bacterium]